MMRLEDEGSRVAGTFINYRRDDASGVAGRLYDHLAKSISRQSLFMDIDAMKPGLDFTKQLDAQIAQCDVLIAIIGPQWLNAKDPAGQRRLDGKKDYVRLEIAAALARGIPVIPVLVNGAEMPDEDALPDDLKDLTRRHGLELRHTRFNADADAILAALKDLRLGDKKSLKRWWPVAVGGVLAVLVIGGGSIYWFAKQKTSSDTFDPVAHWTSNCQPVGSRE